jgi:preprotein translocase subunit SecB
MQPDETETTAQLDPTRQILVNAQYVKDLSFENPAAPASLLMQKVQPKIDLTVNIQANKLQENTYEVTLHITAKASGEDKTLFLADLQYAGVFTISEVLDAQKEAVLLVYSPSILFPFARRIIADVTRDGGFPPLMLDPIDFAALYHKRNADAAGAAAEENKVLN